MSLRATIIDEAIKVLGSTPEGMYRSRLMQLIRTANPSLEQENVGYYLRHWKTEDSHADVPVLANHDETGFFQLTESNLKRNSDDGIQKDTGSRKPYTRKDQRRMVDLYESGLTLKEIASQFDCCVKTVRTALRKCGVSVRRGKLSQRERLQMASLYKQGLSTPKIAVKFKCHASYVVQILRSLGVEIRPAAIPLNVTPQDSCRMVDAYRNGRTVQSIADEFGISSTPVTRILREMGVTLRPGAGHPIFSEPDRRRMAEMYQNGRSQREIATLFGCSTTAIAFALREHGVQSRSSCPTHRFSDEEHDRMATMYQNGKTQREIARVFECSHWAVGHALRKLGIKIRRRKPPGKRKYSEEDCLRMADMYDNGLTQNEIAEKFGCSQRMVSKAICSLQRKNTRTPVAKDTVHTPEKMLEDLIRDYWQEKNRAVEMMVLPADVREKILEHVGDAFGYALETLRGK